MSLVCPSHLPCKITGCWYYLSSRRLQGRRDCPTFPLTPSFTARFPRAPNLRFAVAFTGHATFLVAAAAFWLSHLVLGNDKWVRDACSFTVIMLIALSEVRWQAMHEGAC